MSPRIAAVTGALLFALLVPAGAGAAVIDPLEPCYVTAGTAEAPKAEPITIRAAGFTPNSTVDLMLDGQTPPGGQGLKINDAGNLNLPDALPAPFIAKGSREFAVTLTEVNNPANAVTATAMTTALDVSMNPPNARRSKVIRFKGSGFTAPKAVYAHYVFKGRLRKTVRMARKTSLCGGWTAHKPQIPVKEPKLGVWTIQFDQSKRYITTTAPRVLIVITFTPGVAKP